MKTLKLIVVFLIAGTVALFAQKINIKPTDAVVKWTGNKIGGAHNGEIKVKSGTLVLNAGNIVKGSVVIDMKSMTCADIENEAVNQKLIEHLISDDFFGVEKYPVASFTLIKATKFNKGKATVAGSLTIKGKTEPVSFEIKKVNNVYSTQLKVDRSKFDVRYGSNSFFDNLGDKAIDNIFILDIQLTVK
ncbi:MAG: YceI family protein [Paludibacter sp.]|nr:YceI family protein [Paludibacter sp.]